jgi:hypothetical protein
MRLGLNTDLRELRAERPPVLRIANFNDSYARPDVGAHQSGSPPMQFGVDAYRAPPPRGF